MTERGSFIMHNKLIMLGIGVFLALCAAYVNMQLIMGNIMPLLLAGFAVFAAVVIMKSLYPAVIAFGILMPFDFPNPFIQAMPFYAMILGVCTACYIISLVLSKRLVRLPSANRAVIIFFSLMVLRYLMNPSLPGYAIGVSEDVSGFRAWFSFFVSLGTVLMIGNFINGWDRFHKFLRGLMWTSAFLIPVFLLLMPFSNFRVASLLHGLGIYITFFENGWFRFVFLPTLGMILIAATLLPALFGISRSARWVFICMGFVAVLAGANRVSFISMIVLVVVVFIAKRSYVYLATCLTVLAILLAGGLIAFYAGVISSGSPGVRLLSVVNQDISRQTGADLTVEWRMLRWRMALADIKRHPLLGSGFGGLRDSMTTFNPYTGGGMGESSVEVYVAAGGTHNGYLTAARALGIPAALLMIWVLLTQFIRRFGEARSAESGLMQDAFTFVAAFQAVFIVSMFVSMEPQSPMLWMFLSLGFILEAIVKRHSRPFSPER